MKLEKKHLDWIGIIAIIVMLLGCYLLIQEHKACEDPLKNIILPYLKEKNITEYNSIKINVYKFHGDSIHLESIELFSMPLNNPNINFPINFSE